MVRAAHAHDEAHVDYLVMDGRTEAPVRVLVVDDDPSIVELLTFTLTLEGYAVMAAANGMEAISAAQVDRPDVMLLDVMMPLMDGFAVVRALKRFDDTRDIPVVILTARAARDLESGDSAGADGYLTKPVDVARLLGEISRVLDPAGSPA